MSETLDLICRIHGHVGPYVVAGVRAGERALEHLDARPHFGVDAIVTAPDAPPPSCFIDGVQLSTGCTLGKRNIEHVIGETVELILRNRDTGEAVRVVLNQDLVARAVEVLQMRSDVEAGAFMLECPWDELLTLEACQWPR